MTLLAATPLPIPPMNYSAILPWLILSGTAMLIILMLAIKRTSVTQVYAVVTISGAVASAIAAWSLWAKVGGKKAVYAFGGMVAADRFGCYLSILLCAVLILAVLLTEHHFARDVSGRAEYYILMLFSTAGMQLMATANNLVTVFIAIEILSVCLYVLAAFNRDSPVSQEAGVKYLLLGAYSSAIMLFGIALLYGATGTTNFAKLAQYVSTNIVYKPGLLLFGLTLTIVGLAFKIAAVPFHMWTPDVYQGSPTPVVGFMASGAKIAGFAGLFRLLESGLPAYVVDWQSVIWVLSVLSMFVGSAMAIVQKNVKRMLAYSSIAHAGFILVGLAAGNAEGRKGSLFYLAAYSFMVMGAFAIVAVIGGRGEANTTFDDYKGLFRREPVLATVLTFFLFAMAGFPGTSGFVAKFAVFAGAAAGKQFSLVVLGAVASVVSLFFYLRLVVLMYMEDPATELVLNEDGAIMRIGVPGASQALLAITVGATLLLGILPQGLLNFAGKAGLIFSGSA